MDYDNRTRTDYVYKEENRFRVSGRGISWRAIIAGTLTVIAISVLLNLLGLAAGFGSIDPVEEQHPFSGLGTGALIWWLASNLIALFCGGWVAGRAGRSATNNGGLIQGFITWALYSIISIWLVTSAVGSIISGVGNLVGSTISTAGNAIENVANSNKQQNQMERRKNQQNNFSLQNLKKDVYAILEDTEKRKLDPDRLQNKAQDVKQDVRQEITDRQFGSFNAEIERIFNEAQSEFDSTLQALDKEALSSVIAERTELTEQQAMQRIEQASSKYENLAKRTEAEMQELKQQAEEAADKAADAVASAALWLAIVLIVGAITAALGGLVGAKKLRNDYKETFKRREEYSRT